VTSSGDSLPDAYTKALAGAGAATLSVLWGLEMAQRRLHPPAIPDLRRAIGPAAARLEEALLAFQEVGAPPDLEAFHEQLAAGVELALEAARLFGDPAPPHERVARILESMRRHARAQEALYPLRRALPPLGRHFAEAPWHERLEQLDPDPPPGVRVGLRRARPGEEEEGRGGFSLYVPERYDARTPRPLVVALHGGSGQGRDFVWTWLREARSRGFLLLSPTSVGATWSLEAPRVDVANLESMIEYVCTHWNVDRARILLTGLSDGATFALLAGLAEDAPYTALAPVSGVLSPLNFANGNMARARGRRIYLVHGALDWLFPVGLARAARDELERVGADLTYRELEDLSHAYPREENDRILTWFDPDLALR
jgi:phospholipase/carboxylesterase